MEELHEGKAVVRVPEVKTLRLGDNLGKRAGDLARGA